MASLKLALEYGLKNIESLLSDPDLEKLRRDPQFQELQIKLPEKKI
jgi:hypothetical protein